MDISGPCWKIKRGVDETLDENPLQINLIQILRENYINPRDSTCLLLFEMTST